MEKILDWNMEKLWSICGKTDVEKPWRLDTLENYRLEKPKTRYNGVVRETTEWMEKCFGKL